MMDILEIDVTSFAARVGHVAAADIAGLIEHGDIAPDPAWYAGDLALKPLEPGRELAADLEAMAAYVLARDVAAETLFRWNVDQGRAAGDWAAMPLYARAAYGLFLVAAREAGRLLGEAQRLAEEAQDAAARPSPPAPKLEDTIFEPIGSLGELRPEAIEAQRLAAGRQDQAAAQSGEAADTGDAPPAGDPRAGESGAPMSVGEAPASPPVNKGGRGRRKSG